MANIAPDDDEEHSAAGMVHFALFLINPNVLPSCKDLSSITLLWEEKEHHGRISRIKTFDIFQIYIFLYSISLPFSVFPYHFSGKWKRNDTTAFLTSEWKHRRAESITHQSNKNFLFICFSTLSAYVLSFRFSLIFILFRGKYVDFILIWALNIYDLISLYGWWWWGWAWRRRRRHWKIRRIQSHKFYYVLSSSSAPVTPFIPAFGYPLYHSVYVRLRLKSI